MALSSTPDPISSALPIAIIGAGMAGLAAADSLAKAGKKPVLFDKGRGPGGRMSTRRMTGEDGIERQFDHGAQYFTARDPLFAEQTQRWAAQQAAAKWPDAGPDAWVGVPGMNGVIKAMAAAHDVQWAVRIAAMQRSGTAWHLTSEDGAHFGPFGAVIVAVPAEQVAQLCGDHQPEFAARANAIRSAPCWTVMLGFAAPLPSETVFVQGHGAIGWAARNNAKPGRGIHENWVIQANANWSNTHLEDDKDAVIAPLSKALAEALGLDDISETVLAAAHRWRYAMVPKVPRSQTPFAWDEDVMLGICGDWLSGPRIENAWLSGHYLGAKISAD